MFPGVRPKEFVFLFDQSQWRRLYAYTESVKLSLKQIGANDSGIVADGKYENEVFEKTSKTKSYDSGAYVSSAYTPAYNQSRKSYNSNSSTTSNGESKTKSYDSKPQVELKPQKSIRKKKEFA